MYFGMLITKILKQKSYVTICYKFQKYLQISQFLIAFEHFQLPRFKNNSCK